MAATLVLPGDHVDHFKIVRFLGKGGMGEVYLARDLWLGRKVALKFLQRAASGRALEQMLFEARATARFNHVHIVTVYEVGEWQGAPYLALEYLRGESLQERLGREQLPEPACIRIARAMADALCEAHSHGLVHRDLKPGNVFLCKDGRPRVLDFGIAGRIDPDPGSEAAQSPAPDDEAAAASPAATAETLAYDEAGSSEALDATLAAEEAPLASQELSPTQLPDATSMFQEELIAGAGALCGTPAYMSPEQWQRRPLTGAADIWAWGAVLMEMLTGQRPIPSGPLLSMAALATSDDELELDHQLESISVDLRELLRQSLAKDPKQRPTAHELRERLDQLLLQKREPLGEGQSPFRGLRAFGEEHARFFFGRDAEIDHYLERLREEPVLPVLGASGAGKSSLLQAGVLPRLRERERWWIVRLRPGRQPLHTLAARLSRQETSRSRQLSVLSSSDDLDATSRASQSEGQLEHRLLQNPGLLGQLLASQAEERGLRVLLFVDQMEELFTLGSAPAHREAFLQSLAQAADDPEDPVRVTFTLRDDFLEALSASPWGRELLRSVFLLGRPGPEALQEILTRPLAAVGYSFESPGLVSAMLDAVDGESASLPLLQFAAQMLWDRRDKKRRLLTAKAYREIAGVEGALAHHAETLMGSLTPLQIRHVRELVLRLVTPSGTRRVLTSQELLSGLPDDARELLQRLIQTRLLSARKGQDEAISVELAHESLVHTWSQLSRWLEESKEERQGLAELQQAASLWDRRGRRDDEVWRGDALHDALRLGSRLQLPPLLEAFLRQSQALEQRSRARLRRAQLAGVGLLLCLAALGFWMAATFRTQRDSIDRHSKKLRLQKNISDERLARERVEGARTALTMGHLLQARAKLLSSLLQMDTARGRMLWQRLRRSPLIWKLNTQLEGFRVVFSPSGRHLFFQGQLRTVTMLDVYTKEATYFRGHDDDIFSLAVSPDGTQLVVGTRSGQLTLWDIPGHRATRLASRSRNPVWALCFSPDGRYFASGSYGKLHLWSRRGKRLLRLEHKRPDLMRRRVVRDIAFAPNGRWIAIGGAWNHVHLWEIPSGKWRASLKGHTRAIQQVAISADGTWLATSSWDKQVHVVHLATGARKILSLPHPVLAHGLEFHPRKPDLLALGGATKSIFLWDVRRDRMVQHLRGHTTLIRSLAFHPHQAWLVSLAPHSNQIRLWDLRAQRSQDALHGHLHEIYSLDFHPKGGLIAASDKDAVVLWDRKTGAPVHRFKGHRGGIWQTRFHPRGHTLATGARDRSIRLWDLHKKKLAKILLQHRNEVMDLEFSPRGRFLLSVGRSRDMVQWDSSTGAVLHHFDSGPKGSVGLQSLALHPDGSSFFTGDWSWHLCRWRLQKPMAPCHRMLRARQSIWGLALDARRQKLYVASEDRRVYRWDLKASKQLSPPLGPHPHRLYRAALHPSGDWLLLGSASSFAYLWDLKRKKRYDLPTTPGSETLSIGFSRDGRWMAAGDTYHALHLWQTQSRRPAWRSPWMSAASPVELYSYRGRHQMGLRSLQRLPTPQRWQRRLLKRARLAHRNGSTLCLVRFDGVLERWDLRRSRKAWSRRFAAQALEAVVALERGCAVLERRGSGARAQLLFAGRSHLFAASYIRWQKPHLLVLSGATLHFFQRRGQATHSLDLAKLSNRALPLKEISALMLTPRRIALGTRGGEIHWLPRSPGKEVSQVELENRPLHPVLRLQQGPKGTLFVGYAHGVVGQWDLNSGALLLFKQLNGPIVHLRYLDQKLYAASDKGSYLVRDMRAYTMAYCTLVQRVWETFPVLWRDNRPAFVGAGDLKLRGCVGGAGAPWWE